MFKVYTYMYVCMHYNTHDDPSFHVEFHISIKISFYGCDLENETLGTKLKYLCKHALGGANMKVSLTCCWKIRIYSPTYHYNGCNIPVTRPNRPIRFLLGAFLLVYNVSKKIHKTPQLPTGMIFSLKYLAWSAVRDLELQ